MKRSQLTETGIIAIVLVLLYHFVGAIFTLLTSFLFFSSNNFSGAGRFSILGMIFPVVLYLSAIYLLVRYKKSLARWINRNEPEETGGTLFISPNHLLHIVLIVICFITLVNELPDIIYLLIEAFTIKESYDVPDNAIIMKDNYGLTLFWGSIIRIVLALIILLFSKKISAIWYKKPAAE